MKYISIGFILIGCHEKSHEAITYQLSDGSQISCTIKNRFYCGIELRKCSDGMIYYCQTNIKAKE